jgi:hypothetical protein
MIWFHRLLGSSGVAAQLAASQDEFNSVEVNLVPFFSEESNGMLFLGA